LRHMRMFVEAFSVSALREGSFREFVVCSESDAQ
jgi:hypothetical protein